jgi:hypothetical protein
MEPISTVLTSGQNHPLVINALLRCTREDSRAAPLFERVEKVPGLWVLELGPFAEDSWTDWLAEACQTLTLNASLLQSLGADNAGYTMHVTVYTDPWVPVTVPPSLSQILASCGITLEIFYNDEA